MSESPIKTPKQLAIAVTAAIVIPIVVIKLMAGNFSSDAQESAGSKSQAKEEIAKRLMPVGIAEYTDPNAPKVYQTGEQVYQAVCSSCHTAGLAGAPKFGDAGSWSARISKGLDYLVTNAIKGKNGMPAKGGNADLSDYEIARTVVYMANASGGKFTEPNAPKEEVQTAQATDMTATAGTTTSATATTPAIVIPTAVVATSAKPDGKKLYEAVCSSCHNAGVAGAPKFADKGAWSARIKQGVNVLYASAIKGKGIMPAKGGADASDDEVKAAVDYMVSVAK
jgi:cytochrome c5